MSSALQGARRIVVKVGSSLVTNEGRGVDAVAIGDWCRQMAALVRDGRELVMVSSGAIAEGMKRLGWATRPHAVHELQAAAAVGQMGLAQIYESALRGHGIGSAQVLLTHADLADRERYLNARSTARHAARAGRRAGDQRERHGGQRRDQVRRQRHPGCPRHQFARRRRAGHPHRSARPLLRRSAQRWPGPADRRSRGGRARARTHGRWCWLGARPRRHADQGARGRRARRAAVRARSSLRAANPTC